jgi:hypothetical protein
VSSTFTVFFRQLAVEERDRYFQQDNATAHIADKSNSGLGKDIVCIFHLLINKAISLDKSTVDQNWKMILRIAGVTRLIELVHGTEFWK